MMTQVSKQISQIAATDAEKWATDFRSEMPEFAKVVLGNPGSAQADFVAREMAGAFQRGVEQALSGILDEIKRAKGDD